MIWQFADEEDQVEGALAYQINQGSSLDTANLSSALYHVTMAKKLIADKARFDAENQGSAKVNLSITLFVSNFKKYMGY